MKLYELIEFCEKLIELKEKDINKFYEVKRKIEELSCDNN